MFTKTYLVQIQEVKVCEYEVRATSETAARLDAISKHQADDTIPTHKQVTILRVFRCEDALDN